MKKALTGILILVVFLLMASMLQKQWKLFHPPDLRGAFVPTEAPKWTWLSWFDGSFQDRKTRNIDEQVGFRSDFVRLYNQLDYSLFQLSHAYGIIVGKEGYLFFEEGINNVSGKYRLPENFYPQRVEEYIVIRDSLWARYNIPVLLILAPDKAHYYSEYIPDRYLKKKVTPTKYQSYLKELNQADVPYLDFNGLFLKMKDTVSFNIYPKSGSHWGAYGGMIAFDSLTRYLEQTYHYHLPGRVVDSVVLSRTIQRGDGDMTEAMNLAREPVHIEMAYPQYHFMGTDDTDSLKVLIIGDSFFWQWYDEGGIAHTFPHWQFWYYNQGIYPESFMHYSNAYDLNLIDTLQKFDLILILQTLGGEGKLGFGFLQRAYCEIMFPGRIDEVKDQIRSSPEWFQAVEQKSKIRGIPLETILTREAIYCIYNSLEHKKNSL